GERPEAGQGQAAVSRGGGCGRLQSYRPERPTLDNTHLLRQVSIFQALPQDTIADLAKRVWHKQADAGSVIVSQEEAGDALFVIARGKVKVVLYGETGREIILSMLGAGDFFGEMGLLGASGETVSRALNDFTRRGLLEMQGKKILVRWGFLQKVEDAA